MPLTPGDAALLGGGMLAAGAATFFYRRKQTLPFKVRRMDEAVAPSVGGGRKRGRNQD